MKSALAFALAFLLLLPRIATAQKEYVFAIVPQFPAEKIIAQWYPVLDLVTTKSGHKVNVRTYSSIPEFEAAFLSGVPDFVFLNPYHVMMARKAHGYEPFVRDADLLSGILVVRADSAIRQVSELNGKNIAFPAPNAFGASLYMRALLDQKEKLAIRPQYVHTHSNVYRHVILGKFVAGGGIRDTLEQEGPEVHKMLRVIYSTPEVPSHPVVAHPRVARPVVAEVGQAFIDLAANPAAAKLFRAIQFAQPKATDYREYVALEQPGLERYVVVSRP